MDVPEIHQAQESISILKNPFIADKLDKINIFCSKNLFTGEWQYMANVEFKNGDTQGKQAFKGISLGDLLQKIEAFMKDLEGK